MKSGTWGKIFMGLGAAAQVWDMFKPGGKTEVPTATPMVTVNPIIRKLRFVAAIDPRVVDNVSMLAVWDELAMKVDAIPLFSRPTGKVDPQTVFTFEEYVAFCGWDNT